MILIFLSNNLELGKMINKDYIGTIAENKENYISFNVYINVKLAVVTNKDCKEVRKNVQLRFIDSCRENLFGTGYRAIGLSLISY